MMESKSILNRKIKNYTLLFFVLVFVGQASCIKFRPDVDADNLLAETIVVDGRAREYQLYLPSGLSDHAPLVLVLHGYTDNAKNMMHCTRFNELADKHKFAVCYPQGLVDSTGHTFWEVGYPFTQSIKVDDVHFLTTLVSILQEKFSLSKQNTFVTGMSNGGDMSIVLGCKASSVFRAIAPVCGSFMEVNWNACLGANEIPVLMINSTADSTTYWLGDSVGAQGWGSYRPTLEMVSMYTSINHCVSSKIDTLPDVVKDDKSYVIKESYRNKEDELRVLFYKVIGGGHDWPGNSGNMDIQASDEIWAFFTEIISSSESGK